MNNKLILFPLLALLFAIIGCDIGGVEYDPGIELTTCNSKCGESDGVSNLTWRYDRESKS